LQEQARDLEHLGRDGNFPAASAALPRLESRLVDLYGEMKAFLATPV
jgi:hypothetical protein